MVLYWLKSITGTSQHRFKGSLVYIKTGSQILYHLSISIFVFLFGLHLYPSGDPKQLTLFSSLASNLCNKNEFNKGCNFIPEGVWLGSWGGRGIAS